MTTRLAPGESWLAAVDGGLGVLWRVVPAGTDRPWFVASLNGALAVQSWYLAAAARTWSAPVLWRVPVEDPTRPDLAFVASFPESTAAPKRAVEGDSGGLGLLVAQLGQLFELAPASDVFGCATVTADGKLGTVRGLEHKLQAILAVDANPCVIVAEGQELPAWATRVARIEPRRHARDAVPLFFPDLNASLVRVPSLIERLFRLAGASRDRLPCWAPVAAAARGAAELVRDDRDCWYRRYVEAIALRHHENAGAVELPHYDWFLAEPRSTQMMVARQLVQQAADTRTVEPAVVRAWAAPLLDGHADADALKLRGALARLDAATGDFRSALDTARACAFTWWRFVGDVRREASYPLGTWLRLAGALADRPAYEEAKVFADDYEREFAGGPWVALARAQGALLIGARDTADALLATHPGENGTLASVLCLRALGAKEAGLSQAAHEWMEKLRAALGSIPWAGLSDSAQLALAEFGLSDGSPAAEATLLAALRTLQPGLVRNLQDGHERDPRGLSLGAYLQRFWPY